MQPSTTSPPPELITGRRLLHRTSSHFFILDPTGNVYTVTLTATPTCTCPDGEARTGHGGVRVECSDPHPTIPCKHILFLYVHVLSLSLNDPCLRRRTLRPCQLTRLLSANVSGEAVASETIRRRFHKLYSLWNVNKSLVHVEEGSTCPVCLEELVAGGRRVVACATCKNPIHVGCLVAWKSKRSRTCVICRSRWREMGQEDKYINLKAYVSEDDTQYGQEHCGD